MRMLSMLCDAPSVRGRKGGQFRLILRYSLSRRCGQKGSRRRARHDRAAEGSGFAGGRALCPCRALCPGRPCLGRGAAGRPPASHCPSRCACAPCASPCAASAAPPSRSRSPPSRTRRRRRTASAQPCTREVFLSVSTNGAMEYATRSFAGWRVTGFAADAVTITYNMDSAAAAVSPGSSV